MFTTRFEAWVRRHAEALMSALQRLPVTPNQITVVGTGLTFVAAVLTAFGQLRWGGVVLAFAGTFDILDGALARSTGRSYAYGAFLDSTLDRYSEGAMYLGLIAYFVSAGGPLIFGGAVLTGVVILLAALTNLAALQRIREVWLQGRAQRLARERETRAALTGSEPAKP